MNGAVQAKRILYIVSSDPISPNYRGGGSAIYHDHLLSLAALGHEIHLWHYAYPDTRASFDRFVAGEPEMWLGVRSLCRSVRLTTFAARQSLVDRLSNKVQGLAFGRNPLPRRAALRELQSLMTETRPELVWAQHFEPTMIALAQAEVPVVYSHHDWLYRIKALRFGRVEDGRVRALEQRVVRQVAAVVSGSAVECAELRRLGCRQVHYIPVGYDPAPWPESAQPGEKVRLVHLGGMGTTATRIGMERFFEVVWPRLRGEGLELLVVGDTAAAGPGLKVLLETVHCVGYVQDLGAVLEPFELHIIPWEHSTGQRTRVPVAFNYGQVVVAVRSSVACFPEAVDGLNCRLVDRLEEMADVILELRSDRAQRGRLGRAARSTFEKSFTRRALVPRLGAVVKAVAG